MTNNPTIDGVSRELLERILAWLHTDDPDDGGWISELRALLDAPAVEQQEPLKWLVKCCYGPVSKSVEKADESFWGSLKEARQYYGTDGEIDAVKASKLVYISPGEWFAVPLYRDPPEVAALQSTIARLEARITQLESEKEFAAATYQAARDRIAELESGRGEPVANCFERRNGAGEWINDSNVWLDGIPCSGILKECEKYPDLYRIRLAYAAPPAPVAVALPELDSAFEKWWEEDGQYCRAGGGSYEKTFAYRAYEAALEATASLNVVEDGKARDA